MFDIKCKFWSISIMAQLLDVHGLSVHSVRTADTRGVNGNVFLCLSRLLVCLYLPPSPPPSNGALINNVYFAE